MTQYRQILRLHSQRNSHRSIAQSCRCFRNTASAFSSGPVPSFGIYAYTEACLSMDMANRIYAHVHMLTYFGGAATTFVPDNLKASVDHVNDWFTSQINRI